jgi:hypothetical protein
MHKSDQTVHKESDDSMCMKIVDMMFWYNSGNSWQLATGTIFQSSVDSMELCIKMTSILLLKWALILVADDHES